MQAKYPNLCIISITHSCKDTLNQKAYNPLNNVPGRQFLSPLLGISKYYLYSLLLIATKRLIGGIPPLDFFATQHQNLDLIKLMDPALIKPDNRQSRGIHKTGL